MSCSGRAIPLQAYMPFYFFPAGKNNENYEIMDILILNWSHFPYGINRPTHTFFYIGCIWYRNNRLIHHALY